MLHNILQCTRMASLVHTQALGYFQRKHEKKRLEMRKRLESLEYATIYEDTYAKISTFITHHNEPGGIQQSTRLCNATEEAKRVVQILLKYGIATSFSVTEEPLPIVCITLKTATRGVLVREVLSFQGEVW